jgi:SpoVK/Ycf46/Vps4 family AAA+-type ATPase
VKASVAGDARTLRRTVDAIVAEERAKQHNVLADRLQQIADTSSMTTMNNVARINPESGRGARDFFSDITPRRRLEEIILPEQTLLAVGQLIEEQQRASLLRAHALEPRHRILLVGPPGNGKTTLAEAVAEALALPFFVVRYEAMIGSFLGETASRLKRVFDYVRTTPCVLFFDEFDAIGKERGDKHETGEIKRVVTSLLMQVDELPSYVVVIAATNHAELLDRAVWRRFQLRLNLPSPTQRQLADYLTARSEKANFNLEVSPTRIVKALGPISYAEAEEFITDVFRRSVLSGGVQRTGEIVSEQMALWNERGKISDKNKGHRINGGTAAT